MRCAAWLFTICLAVWYPSGAAWAESTPIGVRVGNHPSHGRVVFDLAAGSRYEVQQAEGQLVLRFGGAGVINLNAAKQPPRNVLALTAVEGGASIMYRAGARPRVYKLGSRLVVDVADPISEINSVEAPSRPPVATARRGVQASPSRAALPAASTGGNGRQPGPTMALQRLVAPSLPPTPSAVPPSSSPVLRTAPMPALAITELAAPDAMKVRIVTQPGRGRGLALTWPEAPAAAIFRRGDWLMVVFDKERNLDLTLLRGDPVFGGAEVQRLTDATVLRLPIAAPAVLIPRKDGNNWFLEAAHEPEAGRSIVLEPSPGPPVRLMLRARATGHTVTMADPETGQALLVGTVSEAGQSVPQLRRLPQADLLPTILGSAVLARSDRITFEARDDRFVLAADDAGLRLGSAIGEEPVAEAAALSRVFDFPNLSVEALQERLRAQLASVTAVPRLVRGKARRDAAATLLTLGLPQEAQSMLGIGFREDPHLREDALAVALHGIAALLAGRATEAQDIEDASLPESDEAALWRALLLASRGRADAAAGAIAVGLPLLRTYPELLRRRLAPLAAEALVEGGEGLAAHRLVDEAAADPALDFARGMLKEREGANAEALALYDAVASGRDRLQRAKALRRAIELRLATGEFDAGKAAAALGAALYAWRGDAEEIAVRQRVAALRAAAGDHRGAMAILQETAAMAPEQAVAMRPLIQAQLMAAIEVEPPLLAVALFDAHKELLPAEGSEALTVLLADRLSSLDLTDRAAALLDKAIAASKGLPAAALTTGLARIRLQDGDAESALSALRMPVAEGMSEAAGIERQFIAAKAEARRGDLLAAAARLRPLGKEGLTTLAELQARAQDWPAAADSLAMLVKALPSGTAVLAEPERLLLVRLAAFSALAGDQARLAALRKSFASRFADGSLSEAFLLLTAEGLRGLSDLPRLQRELDLMRQLPHRLEPLRTAGLTAG